MRDGFRILDIDRHVMEPLDMWPEYLPAHMKSYAPVATPGMRADDTVASRLERLGDYALLPTPPLITVNGQPIMRRVPEAAYIQLGLIAHERTELLFSAETPHGHIVDMDDAGVDVAVLLPNFAPYLVYNDDTSAAHSRAYAQAYNRWLADFCIHDPDRLMGAALISRHDPHAMVVDLEQAVRDQFSAVIIRPNPVRGQTLGSPAYVPFWQACEHHSVTVLVHEGSHAHVATTGMDRFDTYIAQHACSHPMEAMMALLAVIEAGVLEQHPGLRLVFLEAGCGWLPYWLWRLDQEYSLMGQEVRTRVRRPPSEYFQRQVWIALEPGEPMLGPIASSLGPERMVFGTDFPHLDHGADIIDEIFARRAELGDDALRAILWDNSAHLMGLHRSALEQDVGASA